MKTITMTNNIDRQCAEECWNTAGCYRFFITGEKCNFVIGNFLNDLSVQSRNNVCQKLRFLQKLFK
jgi:hypothetical protein